MTYIHPHVATGRHIASRGVISVRPLAAAAANQKKRGVSRSEWPGTRLASSGQCYEVGYVTRWPFLTL